MSIETLKDVVLSVETHNKRTGGDWKLLRHPRNISHVDLTDDEIKVLYRAIRSNGKSLKLDFDEEFNKEIEDLRLHDKIITIDFRR